MKRICALIAVLWMLFILFPSIGLPAVPAQGEKEGIAIFNEGQAIWQKAKTKENWEKALKKYEQALEIFKRAKSDKWQAPTLNNIGLAYKNMGQNQKALEYYEKGLVLHKKTNNIKGQGVGTGQYGRGIPGVG